VPAWRIYYADGTTFDSTDGAWEDAPLDGVICVVRRDGDRTEFHSGAEQYRRFEDDGTIAETADISSWLREYCRWMKHGIGVSNRKMEAIMQRARDDFQAGR
jgi:hypothetical protein